MYSFSLKLTTVGHDCADGVRGGQFGHCTKISCNILNYCGDTAF